MIDFKNARLLKLKPVDNKTYEKEVGQLLIHDEELLGCFRGVRDGVVFTNKRIITINIQGVTGTKKDFTSIAYKKIHAFSIETAGIMDLDSELVLWISELGSIRFEFVSRADIAGLCRAISECIL